jgi:hypothetical protein
LIAAASLSSPAYAFDYFEHRYLGIAAYKTAYEEVVARYQDPQFEHALDEAGKTLGFDIRIDAPKDSVDRMLNELPLNFGDLSALAADYTGNPKELQVLVGDMLSTGGLKGIFSTERQKARAMIIGSRQNWFGACRWFYREVSRDNASSHADPKNWGRCFESAPIENLSVAAKPTMFGSSGYRPSPQELAQQEAIPGAIALVSENKTHFPRYSWREFDRYHRKALELADCYRERAQGSPCEPGLGERDLLAKALLNEAFAQHYLHDSFAAGHIGVSQRTTKQRLKQTHDVLNEIGLDVVITDPPPYLLDCQGCPENTDPQQLVKRLAKDGWTVFGDDHLLIPEADFQRAVIIKTAAKSMVEVLERAKAPQECQMCTARIFPIPKDEYLLSKSDATDDLVAFENQGITGGWESRSKDPRVPGIPVEGWKIGFGYASQYLGSQDNPNVKTGSSEAGTMFKLDYLRNADPRWPNSVGIEFWSLPNLRTSYLVTVGYSRPLEVSPLSLALKAKFGWQVQDNFTPRNPTSQRINGLELSPLSLEITWAFYPPFAVFVQLTPWTAVVTQSGDYSDGIYGVVGVRFDLAGVGRD